MTRDAASQIVLGVLSENFYFEVTELSEDKHIKDTSFEKNLGLDSLDIVELELELEKKINVPLNQQTELCNTVGDLINMIEKFD